MQAGQQFPQESVASSNGQSALHDLFALTDEQILEIEPEGQGEVVSGESRVARQQTPRNAGDPASPNQPNQMKGAPESPMADEAAGSPSSTSHESQVTSHDSEPPAWLAAQMKDPWSGEEARDLWNGVQQARAETAAYREVFAKPEDARALKEIYPGGVNEARAAAERARKLDEIDRSYFGAAGASPEQSSAARAQLAAMMLREDPAAFREMVFAGLRALEEVRVTPAGSSYSSTPNSPDSATQRLSHDFSAAGREDSGPSLGMTEQKSVLKSKGSAHEAQVAAYAEFEKAANEELERSVGGAIERTLAQALPASSRTDGAALGGRLSSAIRQEVEVALKGDRQLGEQVAQILSGRRLDEEARGQVVRLIGERAQQLLPGAAKRVINEWTQATFAAHRAQSGRTEAASARREIAPASPATSLVASARQNSNPGSSRDATPPRVDYRKLSDEQILEL